MPFPSRQWDGPPQAQERPLAPRDIGLTADPGVGVERARYDHIHPDGNVQTVRKTSDAPSTTSDTTVNNDPELLLPIGANETHVWDALILYTANTAGDIKVTFTGPSGSTLAWNAIGPDSGITVYDVNAQVTRAGAAESGHGGSGTSRVLWVRGIIVNGATAGNLQFAWAQLASDVGATNVLTNSYLTARRIT